MVEKRIDGIKKFDKEELKRSRKIVLDTIKKYGKLQPIDSSQAAKTVNGVLAKKKKLDVLLFYYYLVFEHTQVERKSYYTDKIIDGPTYIKNSLNNNMFSTPAWNKLIRTEFAKSICFQPKYYFEDLEYSHSLMLRANRVGIMNDYLYLFLHGSNTPELWCAQYPSMTRG